MITSTVAREYAKALFQLAKQTDRLDELAGELNAFTALVRADRSIRNFLSAPSLSMEKRITSLKKVLAGRVSDQFLKFVLVLCSKRRQDQLEGICASYHLELDRYYNRIEVLVHSAVELSETECRSLTDKLAGQLKRKIVLRASVDRNLLGGMVCRIGDVVYDGSLRRRMQRLSEQMLKAKI
ncbi:MAG: ATP synthase F1 subunit delta [Candidatus Glassbacteria bacterium]